jgi:hypothetical protein
MMTTVATTKPFVKLAAAKPSEIAAQCELTEPARALINDGVRPEAYVNALIERNLLPDAVRFLAQGLMHREAVWWACLAARATTAPPPDAKSAAALEAAEAWVFKPDENARYTAMSKAQETEMDTPAAWAAISAFWSGGSLAPPNLPAVPPPRHLIGRAVSTALMIATYSAVNTEHEPRFRRFLAQGMDIAAGGNGRVQERA